MNINIHETSTVQGQLNGVNPQLITVGKYCVVGSRAALLTHCPIKGAKPIVLGDYVWIGYGALVLPGVTIGDCCIVGAGAVVARDVPSHSIVVGVPAKVLRTLTDEEVSSLISQLESKDPVGKERSNGNP